MALENESFKELVKGQLDFEQWKFLMLLFFIGSLLRIFIKVSKRDDKSKKISITYWVKDIRNWAKLAYSILLMYVLIRFYSEFEVYIKTFIPEKIQASIYLMTLILGFYLHKLADRLDNKIISGKAKQSSLIGDRPDDR